MGNWHPGLLVTHWQLSVRDKLAAGFDKDRNILINIVDGVGTFSKESEDFY